jgi:hypothetical protein
MFSEPLDAACARRRKKAASRLQRHLFVATDPSWCLSSCWCCSDDDADADADAAYDRCRFRRLHLQEPVTLPQIALSEPFQPPFGLPPWIYRWF